MVAPQCKRIPWSSNEMRIVFIGASQFGLKCLQEVRNLENCEIVGIVTAPQKFNISYNPKGVVNVLHANVKEYALEYQIPCREIDQGMKDESLFAEVCSWKPDIFLVVGWYHMVPRNWREVASAFGLHASLLPDYSGGAPLVWAIINGENKTGITFFQFNDGVDNGPIVGQAETNINNDDTIATLYSRIEDLGLDLIRENLPKLADGTANFLEQDEANRRIFPQREPKDGEIDWQKPAIEIYNFVRAQTRPYPGAFTLFNGKQLKIWDVRLCDSIASSNIRPGEVLLNTESMLVKTGSGVLEVKAASIDDESFNGFQIREFIDGGSKLGS